MAVMRPSSKRQCSQVHRGFESHPLRPQQKQPRSSSEDRGCSVNTATRLAGVSGFQSQRQVANDVRVVKCPQYVHISPRLSITLPTSAAGQRRLPRQVGPLPQVVGNRSPRSLRSERLEAVASPSSHHAPVVESFSSTTTSAASSGA